MRKGATLVASNNIITEITKSKKKASQCIREYYRKNKYVGAKDKKLIEFLVYQFLKNYFSIKKIFIQNNIVFSTRNILLFIYFKKFSEEPLTELYLGKYSLKKNEKIDEFIYTVSKKFKSSILPVLPSWLNDKLRKFSDTETKEFYNSILGQGKLDIRVNSMNYKREQVLKLLHNANIEALPTSVSPVGITIQKKIPQHKLKKIKLDYFEVQDEGSQIMSLLSGVEPHMKVLDYCAGKGTKTLALYSLMYGKGEIFAFEKDDRRSLHLKKRFKELKLDKIKILEKTEGYKNYFDLVLIDVPCSGSGTWRRRPEDLLRLKKVDYDNLLKVQIEILNKASLLCKVNGILTYITCSIFEEENEMQILNFLKMNKNFEKRNIKNIFLNSPLNVFKQEKSFLTLLPTSLNTDGYFISSIKKIA